MLNYFLKALKRFRTGDTAGPDTGTALVRAFSEMLVEMRELDRQHPRWAPPVYTCDAVHVQMFADTDTDCIRVCMQHPGVRDMTAKLTLVLEPTPVLLIEATRETRELYEPKPNPNVVVWRIVDAADAAELRQHLIEHLTRIHHAFALPPLTREECRY